MIRDSFRTIFKNPKIIIGFALPVLAILALYIPFFMSFFNIVDMDVDMYMMPIIMLGIMLVIFLLMLAIQFVYNPILYNYVYEAASGEVQAGWAKRGLKRNWWKIFVTTILAMIPYYILYFIMMIVMMTFMFQTPDDPILFALGIGGFFIIVALFWAAFFTIAIVSVVAEEDYGEGLKSIFTFGFKNYMKLVLTNLVIYGGIIAAWISYIVISDDYFGWPSRWYSYSGPVMDVSLVVALGIVSIVLYAIIGSFLYTYANKLFINRREELRERAAQKMLAQQEQPSTDEKI